jgi:hypothetical protein
VTPALTGGLDELRRDGLTVLRRLVDPARAARLREVADGLRARYLERDPLSGRRGFLVGSWHVETIHHPGFFEGAPDWWRPELLDLMAEPRILDLWRAVAGSEPVFARASLFMDPPLPYALDPAMHAVAAPDGAGHWHRDVGVEPDDEVERAALLSGELRRDDGYLLEIALLPSDAFEYVPGSHLRWDTPAELAARKHGQTVVERTRPLPGACRVRLEAGDAVLVDGTGIHRGWYTHGVARRTITLWYLGARHLSVYPAGDVRVRCLVEPEELERLRPATASFFRTWRSWSENER